VSVPAGLGGSCRGDPRGTRRRPPERNSQSTRLPPASATSSSPRLGTGRPQMGSWPGPLPTPGSLSHSRLRSGLRMASPSGPQPTKRLVVSRGPRIATSPVSMAGARSFLSAQPSSLCTCRWPAPSSTTKRPPAGSCATEHGPAATLRWRSGSSPWVKHATYSSLLFSCGPGRQAWGQRTGRGGWLERGAPASGS
uniref:Uncharacterized protein n=1 Tax=Neovison vison TaxID=452646 RepID=A0A8C7C3I2_NEOVI